MTIGNSRYPYRCFLRLFATYSPQERLIRLGRFVWARGQMMKGGYTAMVSLGLRPKLFQFSRGFNEWRLTLAGIRLHYERSYGGVIC